ncbi:uncharacterized protein AB675_8078 [Cyphellophora attinorum]|uniref:Uncharacterized protein n=1 Tax=Cyphellophora attinorum TaxID=1664694 RepID=A0A0N1HRP7_9EURO|nr:uncharacterized protein AB675_8078 [Phialophora attinorum]KPI41027.1 hypothetical protein AB675_8078 [Phialophora attinorum]
MAPKTRRKVYSDSLQHTFPTHAFWEPETSANIWIGDVGYIDHDGNWQRLRRHTIQNVTTDQHDWGVVHSENVKKRSVQGKAALKAPDAPAGAQAHTRYTSDSQFGAMLVTQGPVRRHQCGKESDARNHVMNHRKELACNFPDVIEYGVCVVTKIWTSRKASTTAWSSGSKTKAVAFDVTVFDVGTMGGGVQREIVQHVGPDFRYWKGSAQDSCILGFGGLKFRYHKLICGILVFSELDPENDRTKWRTLRMFRKQSNRSEGDFKDLPVSDKQCSASSSETLVESVSPRTGQARKISKLEELEELSIKEVQDLQEKAKNDDKAQHSYLVEDGLVFWVQAVVDHVQRFGPPPPDNDPASMDRHTESRAKFNGPIDQMRGLGLASQPQSERSFNKQNPSVNFSRHYTPITKHEPYKSSKYEMGYSSLPRGNARHEVGSLRTTRHIDSHQSDVGNRNDIDGSVNPRHDSNLISQRRSQRSTNKQNIAREANKSSEHRTKDPSNPRHPTRNSRHDDSTPERQNMRTAITVTMKPATVPTLLTMVPRATMDRSVC